MKSANKAIKCIFKKLSFLGGENLISIISNIKLRLKASLYNVNKNRLVKKIQKKETINIVFFVYKLSMWKYEGLLKLLLNNNRFIPIVIPSIRETDDENNNLLEHQAIVDYCTNNNFPYRLGYDFQHKKYSDLSNLNPDIVIYTQPYNQTYEKWRIDNFKRNCLFVYTPYGLSVTISPNLYDTYLMNIAWKIFTANELESKILIRERTLKYNNAVVTGAPIYDQIKEANIDKSPWRNNDKLKLIWAPHHSIDSKFSFCNSSFESICSSMIELAIKYQDKIEIAFKPHPVLYDRLIEKWGESKAYEYYAQWENMSNTFICKGMYFELFAFSDGMIHDSCSFVGEYLFVNKPVMYVCRNKDIPEGINNEFGIACFEQHYHGYGINDIEKFINMLLNKKDPMLDKRTEFVKANLYPPNTCSVAENMFNVLQTL